MTKLLHIGLGKCASTFLQKEVFPILAKKVNSNFIIFSNNEFFKIEKNIKFHPLENHKKIDNFLPNNFIISKEDLFSYEWEFVRIEKSFEYIKKNFSSNTVILIIIRNPYDYLNSIYAQSIQELKIVNPENFFYVEKNSNQIRFENKFNLYNFDYKKLIRLYISYFKKVVVVKYEDIHNYEFLNEIYDLDEQFVTKLKKINKTYNKSISNFGIKLILFLNRYFNVEMQQKYLKRLLSDESKSFKNLIIRLFIFNRLFQDKIDKFFPYKKFQIEKSDIPIDIDKKIFEYENSSY